MPIYFSDQAPICPVSRDQSLPSMFPLPIRTVIPHAHDLPSAIAAVNIARSIVIQMTQAYVRNNFHKAPPVFPGGYKNLQRVSRWSEITSQRVKRKYKYYGKDENGDTNPEVWVETERLERVVWYDKAWKSYLIFIYGDKGDDGEPV